ncbi:MAG: hypothetical protein JST20_06460 [Bacteroidetes bacterium]|nr:hypothetical protein [Bacteroidota bacterium]
MKDNTKLTRVIYIIGVIGLLIGILDPMEGSIVIAFGSVFITISTYLTKDKYYKLFLISSLSILFGVFFLFYLSSLGGFGGKSTLSWWWGSLILPYPLGWLMSIIVLLIKTFKKTEK